VRANDAGAVSYRETVRSGDAGGGGRARGAAAWPGCGGAPKLRPPLYGTLEGCALAARFPRARRSRVAAFQPIVDLPLAA
jgi:hypothetical protein